MKLSPRKIETIIEPEPVVEGAGVRLKRSIATRRLDYLDPFLLLDHFASSNPRDYEAGFPLHPHRGIETVTYVLRGEVHHKDTLGNSGSIGAGDVQWMTAGRGIMHEEMPQVRPEGIAGFRSEEHTSELQSLAYLVCRLLLEKKKKKIIEYLYSIQ